MNQFQQALVRAYAEGEFAHVTTYAEAKEVGDSLFAFLFSELSTDQDCDNYEQAVGRLTTAMSDIERVLSAIME